MLDFHIYKFRCPVCRRIYTTSLTPLLLGTGRRKCKKCGSTFRDGTREWPQFGGWEKFEYLFPLMALGWIITVISVAWIESPTRSESGHIQRYIVEVLAVIIVPWVPFYLWRAHLIGRSIQRFERHKLFGDTDDFILST